MVQRKHFSRFYRVVLIIVVSFAALIYKIANGSTDKVLIPVVKNNSVIEKIDSAKQFNLYANSLIELKTLNRTQTFFQPYFNNDVFGDSLHLLFFLVSSLTIFFVFLKEDKLGIFNAKLSTYTKKLSTVCIVFLVLLIFRNAYFSSLISKATDHQYTSQLTYLYFSYLEFWVMLCLGIITYILQKGEKIQEAKNQLQKEQDLTI